MNLIDDEWQPPPTHSVQLRRLRILAKSAVSTRDIAKLRAKLLAPPYNGAVPHELRGTVWLLLLNLRSEELMSEKPAAFANSARQAVKDDNSREQIEKDVRRTRPGLARFKKPAVRGALLRLLSLFCARKEVVYIQGFNELLAPFVLLTDTGANPRIVFALFSEFVTRFAPWMLENSESRVFDVLKRLFKYFGRLLLYHDPELYWLLERHMMTPDLYATSWFVTLFARNFTVQSVMVLWDLLLLEDDPLGTSFFGIALLRSKREELLSVDESRIPETLMMLSAKSPEEVKKLWKIGSEMRTMHTPPSFQRLFTDRILDANTKTTPVALYAARSMQASVCLQTTPDDLVSGGAHYFTWDCRTEAEYRAGHLAQAAHLCLDALRKANGKITSETSEAARLELQTAVDLCEPLKNSSHICLIGSGVKEEDNMDINMLALYLTRIGIPYISTLRGGFQQVEKCAGAEDSFSSVELVDYDPMRYQLARRERLYEQKSKTTQKPMREQTLTRNRSMWESPSPRANDANFKQRAPSSSSFRTAFSGTNLFSSFTDVEVGKAFKNALNGNTINSSVSPSLEDRRGKDDSNSSHLQASRPSDAPVPVHNALSSEDMLTVSSSIETSGTDTPSKKFSAGICRPPSAGADYNGIEFTQFSCTPMSCDTPVGENSPGTSSGQNPFDLNSAAVEPKSHIEPRVTQDGPWSSLSLGANFFSNQKSPWGRCAKPGWLDEHTLSYPLSTLPKHFTVNIMDEKVMAGLSLFACKVRSEWVASFRPRGSEFKARFLGVSRNYLLLLSPQNNRSHILEVRLMRHLEDISRITFKRNRPEVVTFEVIKGPEENPSTESIVCLMADGLRECVDLIREFVDEEDKKCEDKELKGENDFGGGQTDGERDIGEEHGPASLNFEPPAHKQKLPEQAAVKRRISSGGDKDFISPKDESNSESNTSRPNPLPITSSVPPIDSYLIEPADNIKFGNVHSASSLRTNQK